MDRRLFVKRAALATAGVILSRYSFASGSNNTYPVVRTPVNKRKFKSPAVEKLIIEIKQNIGNKEIAWMFENCFPNTLDTTVDFSMINGRPDTYVITGDIDAMWLRDSAAQVFPYVDLCKEDKNLQQLIAGVINRHTKCILKDPYANAFYKDEHKISEWSKDDTKMLPGVHERKWEVDSLCYPIRLAFNYYQTTNDTSPFDNQWLSAMKLVVKTFKEQQRFNGNGPYHFQRNTTNATDTQPLGGYGYPVKPNGLICSMFRPSDDAVIYPFNIPANLFAASVLIELYTMLDTIHCDEAFKQELYILVMQIGDGVEKHGKIKTEKYGKIYAYEVNGYGSYNLMDDANAPSLLSLPLLYTQMSIGDTTWSNTRKYTLSIDNPFFFKGKAAEGIGGPHVGIDYIWPMSIITRGLTSNDETEIKSCLDTLQHTHANTGFMHESFHKDDPTKYTRSWFAWANGLFGQFILKVYHAYPHLLS